ncbi:TPA: hypothetical protein ACOECQ_002761 [Stenotrophomonas maltophilia]
MVESALLLIVVVIGPAAAGALLYHLWTTRPRRPTHTHQAVGQIPVARRRRQQALRRHVEVS